MTGSQGTLYIVGIALALVCQISALHANCDRQRVEFELRGYQRGWALTAIEKAGGDAVARCRSVARLNGIHLIRHDIARTNATCQGLLAIIQSNLDKEAATLDSFAAACPPFDDARCEEQSCLRAPLACIMRHAASGFALLPHSL